MTRLIPVALTALLVTACAGGGAGRERVDPEGPPDVRLATVQRHARRLIEGRAGSPEELAASSYVLAHLQTAGYRVELDFVPTRDLVRATNLVALPPGGDPRVVVAAAYDSPRRSAGGDLAMGLFLELARALRVRRAEHSVEFVALAAENTTIHGGRLGSRRLARRLLDERREPAVVTLGLVGTDAGVTATGEGIGEELRDVARSLGVSATASAAECCDRATEAVFAKAGFDHTTVGGDARALGAVLLEYLASPN